MKFLKIIFCLAFLLVPCIVSADVTVAWDQHNDLEVRGYNLFWQEADGTGEIFNVLLESRAITQYTISEINLKPDVLYNAWATAYSYENSGPSNIVSFTRTIAFTPTPSNLPTIEYPVTAPTVMVINTP